MREILYMTLNIIECREFGYSLADFPDLSRSCSYVEGYSLIRVQKR